MTIAYATNYAGGPFYQNPVSPGHTPPTDNLPCPHYREELPGVYGESSTIVTVDALYGRRSHPSYGISSTPSWSCYDTTPFGTLGDVNTAFSPTLSPNYGSIQSPQSTFSCASSESVPRSQPTSSLEAQSRAASPEMLKSPNLHDSHLHDNKDLSSTVPSRKYVRSGRPTTSSASGEKFSQLRNSQRGSCVPHKQIERKYREGLNMEFERLRKAVPTLPQGTDANVIGGTKPSKGMVLAAAIEYIVRVERERDAALNEIERLGGSFRTSKLNALQMDRNMF